MKKILNKMFAFTFCLCCGCSPQTTSSTHSSNEPSASEVPSVSQIESSTSNSISTIPVTRDYERVIIIGVDGAGNNFQYADTPVLDSIAKMGASTHQMRVSTPSISAESWTALLHGVTPSKHLVTNASAEVTPYPLTSDYPSIFRVAHEQDKNLKLASFICWAPINTGIVENNIGVYKHRNKDEDTLIDTVNKYIIDENPNLVFIQLDTVDEIGHSLGYGKASKTYINRISEIDAYIGSIFINLEENNLIDGTLLLITSDHGGIGSSHGGSSDNEIYSSLYAFGKTVIPNAEIKLPEIRDIPAIVAHALNLTRPATWTAKIPENLFNNAGEKTRPLGGELKATKDLVAAMPNLITSHFDFENNYGDRLNNIASSYSLFENDTYKVLGNTGYGFNASNGHLRLENLSLGNDNFSFGTWMEVSTVNNDPVLLGNKNWQSGFNPGLIIACRGNDVKINLGDGSKRWDYSFPTPNGFYGKWNHVLFTFDRINNEIIYYINFVEAGRCSISDGLMNMNFDSGNPYYINNDITENFGQKIPGTLDDITFFNKALTEDEITILKNFYNN